MLFNKEHNTCQSCGLTCHNDHTCDVPFPACKNECDPPHWEPKTKESSAWAGISMTCFLGTCKSAELVEVKLDTIGEPKIWSRTWAYSSESPCNANNMKNFDCCSSSSVGVEARGKNLLKS